MPRPFSLGCLPETVTLRSWQKYQARHNGQFVRLERSFHYDAAFNVGGRPMSDGQRGRFVMLLCIANGLGSVSLTTYLRLVSDRKKAVRDLKAWLAAGLIVAAGRHAESGLKEVAIGSDSDLKEGAIGSELGLNKALRERRLIRDNDLQTDDGLQIDRKIDRSTTSAADASGEPETAPPEPKGRARPAAPPVVPTPKPKPKAAVAVVPLRRPSWLEPYAVAWERANGAGTFGAVAGQCARYLKPLDDAHGAESVAANLARYLAATEAQYHSLAHFAGTFARWGASGGDPLASVRSVMARYGGPQHTPTEAWQEFDPPTRTAISAAGGLAAIWNQAPHTNGRRA